ncbi:YggS family pyridoxal phosphate-dependent enzyme [Alkalimonas delamerensis]|uniref:Pyridoxal phosphate homeostasis protein n=1 Tax=Alkalimonas delamerensis TaxID=265981 RepID=A0ABT9GRY1_9GAMM|nr:YggS family pyridoxal phosphate-dependent enzyme [Alkalimonas delamerensis]MDP4529644.1 YggS family pyridoxal phosphate-dependent enzyme [Alkalimonas delamerensis]
MTTIAERLQSAYRQIAEECTKLGPSAANAQLIAVSKTKPVSDILSAYAAGQRHFGENYPQELAEKVQQLSQYTELCWHFIGPLQSNKTRLVAEAASWCHSLDRVKIAERLSAQRPTNMPALKVLLQVNISQESSKAGITPEAILPLAKTVDALPGLELKGLMTIPAPSAQQQVETAFASMQQLSKELQQHYPKATELSMGMSDDWQLALRYGATMIRLGTAIFGARNYERHE